MPDPNIVVLRKETVVRMIENSIGARIFNSIIVRYKDTGAITDICGDGELSCAFFVSGILTIVGLLHETSATTQTLRQKLSVNGWEQVIDGACEPGDVIFWGLCSYANGTEHGHVGFVLNKDEAVSTSSESKCVARHSINNGRTIASIMRCTQF